MVIALLAGLVPVASSLAPLTARASGSYASTITADHPVSYWRLNETSGSIAADSVGTTPGQILGGTTLGTPGPVPGGGAMTFDGSSGAVYFGQPTSLQPTSWSIEMWFKTTSTPSWSTLMRARAYGYDLGLATGAPAANGYTSSSASFGIGPVGGTFADGTWHYIVATKSASAVTLFLDGVQMGSSPAGSSMYYQLGGIALARDGDSGGYSFQGSLSEAAFYNYPLSATQVAAHLAANSNLPTKPLSVQVTPDVEKLNVSWSASTSPSGPLDGYVVTAFSDFGDVIRSIVGPGATSTTLTGLSSSKTYRLYIAGFNGSGVGASGVAAMSVRPLIQSGLTLGDPASLSSCCADQYPGATAVADVDGDGVPDLVSVSLSTSVSVAKGNGDGSFQAPVAWPANGATTSVAVGDLLGNGHQDIVTADDGPFQGNAGELSILMGAGDGTFAAPTTVADTCPTFVALANLNGDGHLDLAVADGCVSQIHIFFGDGQGNFTAGPSLSTHGGVRSLAIADLNADDMMDIVSADGGPPGADGATVTVFLNAGAGTFAAGQSYRIGDTYAVTNTVAIGDVNNDGAPDIVASNSNCGYNGGDTLVLLNNGAGAFGTASSLNDGCTGAAMLTDLNGDGNLDVVSVNPTGYYNPSSQVRVFMGNGDGTFQPVVNYANGTESAQVINAADLNGDKRPDIILSNKDGTKEVLLNGSTGMIGGALTAAQTRGGGINYCIPCHGDTIRHGNLTTMPIDTATGNFWHVFDDLDLPGRGIRISVARTYNSSAAPINGPLGYGWQLNGGMSLTRTGATVTITQENGSQASFIEQGSAWVPTAPRFIATLTHSANGVWTLVRQARETFTFSSTGQLTSATDLNGYTTTYSYTGSELTGMTDASGRSLSLAWAASHLASVTDANVTPSRVVQYQYNDGNGNLTDVVDAGGDHWQFAYDASHRLTTMKDPNCVASSGCLGVRNVYDNQGRVTSQTDQLNRVTTFDYTSIAGGTKSTDPSGHVTVDYYSFGLRTGTTRGYGTPSAATTQYAYDPATLALTSATDADAHTTSSTVDGSGNVLTAIDALGRQETKTYNSFNEVLTDQDANGITTTMTYDTRGNLSTVSRPDTQDGTTSITVYYHDDAAHPGDVTRMVDPDGKAWHYSYDADGLGQTATDPVGDETITCHDAIGRPTWRISARGTSGLTPASVCAQAASQEGQATQTPPAFTSVVSYVDPTTGTVDGNSLIHATIDADGHKTAVTYDADQNDITSTDALGKTTKNVYDAANEHTQTIRGFGSPQQSTLITDFNPDGSVADQVDGTGATTTYAYDSLGRETASSTPPTQACPSPSPSNPCTTTIYGYDGAGNRTSQQDPGGNCSATPATGCTTYSYDPASELTGITYSDGVTPNVSNIQYDGDGQRISMTDGTGVSTWTYDSLHRMRSSTDGSGVPGGGVTVTYAYNLRGLLTNLTYPGGLRVTRGYDDAGRMTTVVDSQTSKTITVTPDANSNVAGIQYPNNTSATMTFDNADVLTGINDALPTGSTSFGYGRDADNQVSSITTSGAITENHAFGYTPLNQLSQDNAASYRYDLADNLIQKTDGTQQRYDQADEIVSSVRLVGAQQQAPALGTFVTVQLPSGVQAGDEILVATTQASTAAATVPTGYTSLSSVTSSGTPATTTQVFAKRAGSSETNPTLTYSLAARPAIVVAAYRGINSTAVDGAPLTASSASAAQITLSSLATSKIGDQLIMIAGGSGSATAQSWSSPSGTPSGMVKEADTTTQTLATSALFDLPLSNSQNGISETAQVTGSVQPLTGILLALQPQAPTYDLHGNRTSTAVAGGAMASLTYDQANRLTAYNGSATYSYNGDGLRMEKTVSGSPQHFSWDVAEGLPLLLDDGITSYVYGPDGRPLEQVARSIPGPISLVGTGSSVVSSSSTITVPLSGAIQANDQIFVSVTENGTDTVTSSGYGVVQRAATTASKPTATTVLRRTAAGGESSATFTFSASAPNATAVAAVYRGVDPINPTGPLDGPASSTTGSATAATLSVGPVTASYPGEVLLVAQGAAGLKSASSWTAPSGMSERSVQASQSRAASALADQTISGTGSTNTRTITFGTTSQLMAVMVALRPAQPVLYYTSDQLGSTRLVTDQAGVVRATYTYDAYGNVVGQTGTAAPPLLFDAQYLDSESGLYYLRARYYDPMSAQFVSRDPAIRITRSPYGYVGGDPLNRSDVSGLNQNGPYVNTVPAGYSGPTTVCWFIDKYGTELYHVIVGEGETGAETCDRIFAGEGALDVGACVGGCYGSTGLPGGVTYPAEVNGGQYNSGPVVNAALGNRCASLILSAIVTVALPGLELPAAAEVAIDAADIGYEVHEWTHHE